jgi:hypothetical protein
LALGETLGRARGCVPGLRVTAIEGERAPTGFGGGVGGGGVGSGGGGGSTCGGDDAPRGISGWDWDLGSTGAGRKLGGGVNGGGLGGNVGVVVGEFINGGFGGCGGTTDWGSRDCGIVCGGGGGWKAR